MGTVNKVILVGKIVSEPDIRYISKTDDHLAQLTMVTGDEVEHLLVCRGPQALYVKDLVKQETRLYVEGELEYREQRHPQHKDCTWMQAHIRIHSLQLIDAPERAPYPEDIKKIDFRRKKPKG